MLSILGNRKTIVSILTMVFLIVGVQGISYGQVPDLTVSLGSPSLSPAIVDPGEGFDISVTVNTATAASTITALIFYQSPDQSTTTPVGDETVGAAVVPAISTAGGSVNITSRLTAPTIVGTYYYYAHVLPVPTETAANNNTSNTTATLTVQVARRPDLQVTALSFYDPTNPFNLVNPSLYNVVVPGGNFTLQATIENSGDAPFTGPTVAFDYYYSTTFLSSSNVPASEWRPITLPVTITPPIGFAANNRSRRVNISLPAPPPFGTANTYYYHVRVRPVEDVSDATNNPDKNPIIVVTSSADLVVDTPTVSKSTLAPGESFTLTTTVRNQGSGLSGAGTTLRYYRSTDARIDTTTDNTEVGTAATIGILSGLTTFNPVQPNTSSQTVTLTAPDTQGTYYYGAHVSGSTAELNIQNNYSAAVTITVTAPPDLVAEIFEFRPDTVAPGARLTLDATVTNEGEGQSPRTTLRFYESTDRRFSSGDEIDRVTVAELASNRSTSESTRLIAPDTPGTYYYRVSVDEVANEEETFNNTSGYIVLFVETPLTLESVQPSTSTVAPGERFTLTATIRNDGSTTSTRTSVEFYSSDDTRITSTDTSIGTDSVSVIAARGTGQASLTLNAPNTEGTYYYGACLGDGTSSCEVVRITVVEEIIVADFERPPMYWVDADDGTLHSLTDSEIEPFASGARNANSIAVDMAGGKVYWTQQTGANAGRVQRANLSGSNVELVRALNNLPQGIAVDASNGKLYVTNARGKIQRMNLDGRNYEPDFIINLDSPRGIAVDAVGGKVYWTEETGENTGRLQRADLDGSNVESVRELNNVPYGIAVDGSNEKLYVTNSRGKIQQMDLDGRDFEWNFITNLDSPNGIAVDVAAGKIYWTEAGKIRRANLNGGSRQDVVTGIGSLAGIALSVAPVEDAPAAPGAIAATADATALQANYPNPFNPETWIPYQLQHAADVTVTIYDLRGTIVRQLLLGHQPAGVYHSRSRAAHWDGRNNLGEPVASGLYFYTLTAGDFTATRKMLIRK